MLEVKLRAGDLRMIASARPGPETEGCLTLIRERIAQAEAAKALGKVTPRRVGWPFGWPQALQVAERILGAENVTRPPFPEYSWYQTINRVCREYRFTEEYMVSLCNYVRDNIRLPVHFRFIMTQHEAIMAGKYSYPDRAGLPGTRGTGAGATHLASLPRLPDPKED